LVGTVAVVFRLAAWDVFYQYDDGGSNGGIFICNRWRLRDGKRRGVVTAGHLRAPTGGLRAALGETLEFCLWKLGDVRAATFRLAVRVLGAEQCRKAIGGQPPRSAPPHGKFLRLLHSIPDDQNQGFVFKRPGGRERSTAVRRTFCLLGDNTESHLVSVVATRCAFCLL